MMTTQKISSDIRKEQIVAAALQVLGDSKVERLKVTDIASHLKLAPSALYRHFRNKDAILMAILEHVRDRLHENLEIVRESKVNAVDQLHGLLQRHANLISRNHGIPRIVFSDELWGQKGTKRKHLYKTVTSYLEELEDIVCQGQERGEIREDIDAAVVARMFLGIVQPGALLWHMSEGNFDIEGHVEKAWPVFKKMLTGQ